MYEDFNDIYRFGVACKTRNGNIVFQRSGGESDCEGNMVLQLFTVVSLCSFIYELENWTFKIREKRNRSI
jgi:hypothetical protein